jgi:hypothetical protein
MGLWGIALLTLALNARAGAFFILPVLVLWLAFSFRERIPVMRSGVLAGAVVFVIFMTRGWIGKIVLFIRVYSYR